MICSNPHDYQHRKYNKLYTLSFVPKEFRVKAKYYSAENEETFQYPYILKPYSCDSFSIGVKKINNSDERDAYLTTFHPEFTMIEEYTEYPNEIGVTYVFENNSYNYVSCVKRINHYDSIIHYGKEYFNNIWDGKPSGIKREDLLTKELVNQLDKIGYSIPGNRIGRYDIKYKSDNRLKQGKSFIVLEVNGGIGLDLDITTVPVYSLYKRLFYFMKWITVRVVQGYVNLPYINHQRFIKMYLQYGSLIFYHYLLNLSLVKG
jgi:D-alanine-D-alanine ligase-like ATP-grasp enzyme